MSSQVAHIFPADGGGSTWWYLAAAAIIAALVVEHHVVAGFDRRFLARRLQVTVGIGLVAALTLVGSPVGNAQSAGALLPDLISDPPNPSYFNELTTADGTTRLVVTFDGYVHNIGEGALDVVGNPQEPDGMRQRVRNGSAWEDVGSPTVRYETDDGHNHFHLIEAIEYVLWNELQGAQTAVGSKIGFCLVDSEQMEPITDQAYSEELDNFCQENNPSAQSLRMGISPGWRDIYDATTTLQWVDVSDVAPGRYWIGAITDPNDEIRESNEDNNDLIFSDRTIAVPGYAPRPMDPIEVASRVHEFSLRSTAHGTVTRPVYVVEQGPAHGSLDVPIGADLGSAVVRYFPDAGFTGTDEIVFSVHDAASPYPFTRPQQRLEIIVATDESTDTEPEGALGADPSLTAPSTFFETTLGERSAVEFEVSDALGGPARFFAKGLPAGLVADAESGVISGVAVEEGIFAVELVAVAARPEEATSLDVTWIVNPSEVSGGLTDVLDQSSPRGALTRVRIGTNALGLDLEAEGLPPGLSLEEGSPVVVGTPTTAGVYDVRVREVDDGDIVAELAFTWVVRPTVAIDFVL